MRSVPGDITSSCESSDNESVASSSCDESTDCKLFRDSELTVDEAVLSMMELFQNHKLEKSTVSNMLEAVLKLLPKPNQMPKSKHLLFKYVKDLNPLPPAKVHSYCKECLFYLEHESICCTLCKSKDLGHFFQIPLSHQIKYFFEHRDLANHIDNYTEERRVGIQSHIQDICDGSEYRRAKLGGRYDLTLMGHTDGISISKSSKASLWPKEYVICELPPKLRYKYVIVSGVWVDHSKPIMNCFMKPFVDEILDIHNDGGIKWIHPSTKQEETSDVTVPVYCVDAPVRAQIQNILSHGGRHCCNVCEQKMLKLPREPAVLGEKQKSRKRVFTFLENSSELRSGEKMKEQGRVTREKQKQLNKKVNAVKGVKGGSVVSKLPGCDRGTVVYPEYMHLLIGIIKLFMTLWFESDCPGNLKKFRDLIDSFLMNIQVPDFVTRIPRSTDSYSSWKANELRSFLLYYSLIIFQECMTQEHFQHWILFVNGIYLLLQDSISHADIDRAEIMLDMFLRDFSELYGAEHFTYNLHNLSHLALIVRRWGPLSCNSALSFESFNGCLSQYIHGTKNQGKELVNSLELVQGIHVLKVRVQAYQSKYTNKIELSSRARNFVLNQLQRQLLRDMNVNTSVPIYYRATIGDETYTSNSYLRQRKRNNYTVCYNSSDGLEFGEIVCFVEASPTQLLAFVKAFQIEHVRMIIHTGSRTLVKHIIPVKESQNISLIPLKNIKHKVMRVGSFIVLRPNTYEINL